MENGWIFVVVDSASDGSKLVDVFDKDGEFLAQFEIDISTRSATQCKVCFENGWKAGNS